jgi:hypothetical protein
MIDDILKQREQTHGSFAEVSRLAQEFKRVIYSGYNYADLNDQQSEALDMICSKIGRILSGDPNAVDHWRDIAGYAQLIVNACNAVERDPIRPHDAHSPDTPAPAPPAFVVPGRATLP